MNYGVVLPNTGGCGDPRLLAELAHEAEEAGWDGVFVFDSVYSPAWDAPFKDSPAQRAVADPWLALAAMATRTERIVLGPMITPVSRRRPSKLAREVVTLDHLSSGRAVLPVGLGSVDDGGFANMGEELDRKIRAERLDEGLAIVDGLMSGKPFEFQGEHFRVDEIEFLPRPVQEPRVPIWVVGLWGFEKSMARTLRWDGVIPALKGSDGVDGPRLTPDDMRAIRHYAAERRGADAPFDIVHEGASSGGDRSRALDLVEPFVEAGITWWLEAVWMRAWKAPHDVDNLRTRIRQGPPRR